MTNITIESVRLITMLSNIVHTGYYDMNIHLTDMHMHACKKTQIQTTHTATHPHTQTRTHTHIHTHTHMEIAGFMITART